MLKEDTSFIHVVNMQENLNFVKAHFGDTDIGPLLEVSLYKIWLKI